MNYAKRQHKTQSSEAASAPSGFLLSIQKSHLPSNPHCGAVDVPLGVCFATYICFIFEGEKPFSAPKD